MEQDLFPSLPKTEYPSWIEVTGKTLPKEGLEVIGYSQEWVHPDWNENGTRVCYIDSNRLFVSARWSNDADQWVLDDVQPSHYTFMPKNPDLI